MNLVVYTALIGPGWKLHDPAVIEDGVRYVAFTDHDHRSSVWEIVRVTTNGDPRIQSRLLKTKPWLLFPHADASLWLDSKFRLAIEPRRWAEGWLHMWDFVALRHPDRDRIEDEAQAIAQLGKAPLAQVEAQVNRYRGKGWTDQKAITSTGLCLRRHSKTVIDHGNLWWDEIREHGWRDQMSVDYCAWETGLRIGYFPGHYRDNPYARFNPRPQKRIVCITLTADQPHGMRLLERFIQEQDITEPLTWLVVDDGEEPCHLEENRPAWCLYIRRDREPEIDGSESMRRNMALALQHIPQGAQYVVWMEHDDWYHPSHVRRCIEALGNVAATGDDSQRYYSLPGRCWKEFENKGACFSQTAHRVDLLPLVSHAIEESRKIKSIGLDFIFWRQVMEEGKVTYSLEHRESVVGIKGLPGRKGLGIGHQKDFLGMATLDPDGSKLKEWVGEKWAGKYRKINRSS